MVLRAPLQIQDLPSYLTEGKFVGCTNVVMLIKVWDLFESYRVHLIYIESYIAAVLNPSKFRV